MSAFARLLSERTRVVAVTAVSNALGTVVPVTRIVELAHGIGAAVVLDAAQSLPHQPVDVRALGCDFLAFSGHKVFGPTGIGVLYGRLEHLSDMPPYQGGGEMIRSVTFEQTTYADPPARFEAGTPHIAGAVGLAAALDYVNRVGLSDIQSHEQALLAYATERLQAIEGVRLIGTAEEKSAVISWTQDGVHPHDIATVLDRYAVAVRAGHHCAQPVMKRFGVPATVRASFAFYNHQADVDALADAVAAAGEMFR